MVYMCVADSPLCGAFCVSGGGMIGLGVVEYHWEHTVVPGVLWNGKRYSTIAEAARADGCSYAAMYYRVNKGYISPCEMKWYKSIGHLCEVCGSPNTRRHGETRKGTPKYYCRDCKCYRTIKKH